MQEILVVVVPAIILALVAGVGLGWRTAKNKEQVIINDQQVSVEERKLIHTMAAKLLNVQDELLTLTREKTIAEERDKANLDQIKELTQELTEVKELLQKAYKEITRLNLQVEGFFTAIIGGDKLVLSDSTVDNIKKAMKKPVDAIMAETSKKVIDQVAVVTIGETEDTKQKVIDQVSAVEL